jgi:hypothetical protein
MEEIRLFLNLFLRKSNYINEETNFINYKRTLCIFNKGNTYFLYPLHLRCQGVNVHADDCFFSKASIIDSGKSFNKWNQKNII